jgi:hypothetical protein
VRSSVGILLAAQVVVVGGCGLNAEGVGTGDTVDAGSASRRLDARAPRGDAADDRALADVSSHSSSSSSAAMDASHDTGPTDPVDSGHDAHVADAGHDAHVADAGVDAREAASVYAATCAELTLSSGTKTETLYLGGDSDKPWTAVCVTSGGTSKTYLKLPGSNTSSYPPGRCATAVDGGAGVVTTWTMVLFDPTTLTVTTNDLAGATSVGATYEVSGNGAFTHTYSVMFFGSGRSCNMAAAEVGQINLTGTSFVVDPSQMFLLQGFQSAGGAMTTGANTTLDVGGYSAGISPCSDYYTDTGGACLKLAYAP